MLYINHKKSSKTTLILIISLLISLILISSRIYSDIRGEFAKRPTALPPEPAAVVDYLKEDIGNQRASSLRECFSGKIVRVDLSQLGATPTFFEALDKALDNSGLGAFTSKDFLPLQPDSNTSLASPKTFDNNTYYGCYGLGDERIQIDSSSTNITLALRPSSSEYSCRDLYGVTGGICEVLSSCGLTFTGSGTRIGGCLATSANPNNLSNISSALNSNIVIETLTRCIPRRNIYFANPATGSQNFGSYSFVSTKSGGNIIGCSDPALTTACSSGSSNDPMSIDSHYTIDSIRNVPTLSSVDSVFLAKNPRQSYTLAFKILKCPGSA